MIFGIDNSSSRHSKNVCYNFLVLSEGSTDSIDIDDKVNEPKKKLSINFTKSKTKLSLSVH